MTDAEACLVWVWLCAGSLSLALSAAAARFVWVCAWRGPAGLRRIAAEGSEPAAVGFGWYAFRAHRVLDPLSELDGKTEQVYSARVLDYPVQLDYSTSLMLHLDAPGLDRLAVRAYAHDESCDNLQPGDLITVKMKLRSAEKRYGEETDAYLSMGIATIGSVTDAPVKTGEWKYKILCLPKVLAHRVKTVAAEIFPADAFPFAEALMLGDKRALYDAMLDVPPVCRCWAFSRSWRVRRRRCSARALWPRWCCSPRRSSGRTTPRRA